MQLKIYTDGGSRGNPGISGAGIHVEDQDKKIIFQQSLFLGKKTNNESEYLAFFSALEWLKTFTSPSIDKVSCFLDSKLVVEQINKRWKIKEDRLRKLALQCWQILAVLPYSVEIKHVVRAKNEAADRLANEAMDKAADN